VSDPSHAAPDLIEPVAAFRNWRLVDGGLRSPYAPVAWTEPIMCAHCLASSHPAPAPGCDCGLSAYLEPQLAFPTVDFRGVTGIVTLWGRVEVHAEHVRAEYARVEALAVYRQWSARQRTAVEAVAASLGADLVDLREQSAAAELYGGTLSAPAVA
jgi:hypothetical protein